ncbi:MAG: tRNA (guanosine(46)-N7)-methyltransferase TrmB [Legionellales bacterium]|nr:tRNA (guanosine(46)-N7)-methyltransferase TrmB [Legionellales bacterium]
MHNRKATSYQRRTGRVTKEQRAHLASDRHQIASLSTEDLQPLIRQYANTVLEIGFGTGEHLLQNIIDTPDTLHIGIDLYRAGVARMLQQFDKQSLSNAYVLCEDASIAITKCPDEQIDRIDIHHPDPWPKKRHHKRRLIQIEFIKDCLRILKPGGTIEIVTDDSAYFDDIMHLLEHDLESHCQLQTQHEREPNSKYGRKAIIEGRNIQSVSIQKIISTNASMPTSHHGNQAD